MSSNASAKLPNKLNAHCPCLCKLSNDVAFPVGVGGRCRTFPTTKMLQHMERVLVYLARTADLAIHYRAEQTGAKTLVSGVSDSDWYVRRSTTGYVITLAGGCVAHGSRRQHCIAMSSTDGACPRDALCARRAG